MRARRKVGIDSDEVVDVVNMKLPLEMFGSFGAADGVYPAYHMNKLHWISVVLSDAADDLVKFLVNASYEATRDTMGKTLSNSMVRSVHMLLHEAMDSAVREGLVP
ncbi:MAG: MmcQ/YjbR family DNA-binding protein, partial [Ruminococcaceae bacterium]|nr:MmcQ/YjbR family DNA-binding protein [Oscillospiraceae bacterium]